MTQSGNPVQVTDNGAPLWILRPVTKHPSEELAAHAEIDGILSEVLAEKPSEISAARLLEESRR